MTATEQLHQEAHGLDERPATEIAALLAEGQISATESQRRALVDVVAGARIMANTIRQKGQLHYVAAGSSGLMAASDALELGGTFSIPAAQVAIHMAGGLPNGVEMSGSTEDLTDSLDEQFSTLSNRDTVIAVSASGTTPYTVAAAKIAKHRDASVIGIANNIGSELLNIADCAILLQTPPELISGSTRLGAATAQKCVLNTLSTLMAINLGHVHDGMMVNVRADNAKLRSRAIGIVSKIAEVDRPEASIALDAADGEVKPAVLIATGKLSPHEAKAMLEVSDGHLRAALIRITELTDH